MTLSSSAARRIARILSGEADATALRVSVSGGGCSGFQYAFDLDAAREADDLIIERDGAVVVIDATSLPFMTGSQIDFVDDLLGQSFQVNNPNATASCGCGTSFSI
ncbi:MAG: iron-sulfur cluster insertion protein ErpA [Alphaproteobacteria bacterium]